jgi:sRNA-binding carbon storage regulator CsrA
MGLFDNDTSSKKGEVRIGVPDEKDESKLRTEVESKIDSRSSRSSSSQSKSSENSVSRKELKRQNEKIISLLEQLVDEDVSSKRKTGSENDNGMRGGMDELL